MHSYLHVPHHYRFLTSLGNINCQKERISSIPKVIVVILMALMAKSISARQNSECWLTKIKFQIFILSFDWVQATRNYFDWSRILAR